MHTEVRTYLARAVVDEEYLLHQGSLTGFKVSLNVGTENHTVPWDTVLEHVPAVGSNVVTPSGCYIIVILSSVLLGKEAT